MTPIHTGQTRPQMSEATKPSCVIAMCEVQGLHTPSKRGVRARLTEGISKPRVGLLMDLVRGYLNHSQTSLVIRITCGCLKT